MIRRRNTFTKQPAICRAAPLLVCLLVWSMTSVAAQAANHYLNVIDGSGDGSYGKNAWVNVSADPPAPGYEFDEWTGGSDNRFEDRDRSLPNTQYNWQLWQVPSLASGQWTQGLKGTAPVTTTGTVSVNRMPVSVPGTYVLVVWAANVSSNDIKSTTAAALQFGGQYTASGRFTVTASQLRSARLHSRLFLWG